MSLEGIEPIGTASWIAAVLVLYRREFRGGAWFGTGLLCLFLALPISGLWAVAPLQLMKSYPGQDWAVTMLWTLAVTPLAVGLGWLVWTFCRDASE